jgi:hypothetical protein
LRLARFGKSFQQEANLVIAGLIEVPVPLPDGGEVIRCHEADHCIGMPLEFVAGVFCCDRHRDDDLLRSSLPERGDGSAHGVAGCNTIVDQQNALAVYVDGRAVAAIGMLAPFQFARLAVNSLCELLWRYMERAHDLLVDNTDAARGDGAHRQLWLLWRTELANHEDIERRAEGPGDLVRNWDAPARECEDDGLSTGTLLMDELAEVRSQPLSGVDAIGKQGG